MSQISVAMKLDSLRADIRNCFQYSAFVEDVAAMALCNSTFRDGGLVEYREHAVGIDSILYGVVERWSIA